MSLPLSSANLHESIDLNGQWAFALDPHDEGISAGWQTDALTAAIVVPGSWEEQGFGDPPRTHPLGGWSKHHQYEGAAWYSRFIEIPADWSGKSIRLILKGVRWRSEVWLDGAAAGMQESLSTAHVYDLTALVDPRQSPPSDGSHRQPDDLSASKKATSIPTHTATRWGGITGGVVLEALPNVRFDQIICRPNVAERRFEFDFRVSADADLTVDVTLTDPQSGRQYQASGAVTDGSAALSVELGADARLWWDDDPFLYEVEFSLLGWRYNRRRRAAARRAARNLGGRARIFCSTGSRCFLRGYVDCCIFPQTGYPSWDVEHYRRQFAIAKSYGFNHVRLHSWTAPEPFWQAADEAGNASSG